MQLVLEECKGVATVEKVVACCHSDIVLHTVLIAIISNCLR